MNEKIIGLDIGTGSVKVATVSGTFQFPSIISRGKNMEISCDDTSCAEMTLVGYDAVKSEQIKSMVLKTPVYRGAPTSISDYLELVRHALKMVIDPQKDALHDSRKFSECVIIAGIPFSARGQVQKIKQAVEVTFAPKFFGLMYQAKATLDNEGLSDGIVCHIGQGTTEIMAVVHGNIAHAQTILHGVGDITSVLNSSKTGYLNYEIFSKNTPQMIEQRKILANHISDILEKVVIDYPNLAVVFAGGGALIPKLLSEIKNDTIRHIRVAENPVFSNALGMLKKAITYGTH
jgi:actin-like ATPase involved in cell morphogenesis